MAVWLNMTGQDASLCTSLADGTEKIKKMFAMRLTDGAEITPHHNTIVLDVHYKVRSVEYGNEEFWLSDAPESKAHFP
jgi:hypothetical protein